MEMQDLLMKALATRPLRVKAMEMQDLLMKALATKQPGIPTSNGEHHLGRPTTPTRPRRINRRQHR